jgi:hypothetical protein
MGWPTRGARSKPDIRPVLQYTAATCAAFFTLLILVAQVGTASGADDEPDLMQTLVAQDATLNNNLEPIEVRWIRGPDHRELAFGFGVEKVIARNLGSRQ